MNIKHLLLIGCLTLPMLPAGAQTGTPPSGSITGKVIETMNTAGYTYVRADTGKKKVWAASTQFAVKVGDTVAFAPDAPMENYHSKTLDRDFDVVYFAGRIGVNGSDFTTPVPALPPGHPPTASTPAPTQALPPGHPALPGKSAGVDLSLTGIKAATGGKTIEQIYAASAKLAGKPVVVRGKVVKYNEMILGKNWLHIRDGSGSADKKNNDLTVTSTTPVKLGDIVVVTGALATNKDFGSNYKFDVMIDGGQVTVETPATSAH